MGAMLHISMITRRWIKEPQNADRRQEDFFLCELIFTLRKKVFWKRMHTIQKSHASAYYLSFNMISNICIRKRIQFLQFINIIVYLRKKL